MMELIAQRGLPLSGYGEKLFSTENADEEDKEADAIYDAIEERQDQRRKFHREKNEEAQLEEYRKERPKIQQQFAELKRGLEDVSNEEWANIPDV